VKQRTYLATLPQTPPRRWDLVRIVRIVRTSSHKNKKGSGDCGKVGNHPEGVAGVREDRRVLSDRTFHHLSGPGEAGWTIGRSTLIAAWSDRGSTNASFVSSMVRAKPGAKR
jgi:hypothetical protein